MPISVLNNTSALFHIHTTHFTAWRHPWHPPPPLSTTAILTTFVGPNLPLLPPLATTHCHYITVTIPLTIPKPPTTSTCNHTNVNTGLQLPPHPMATTHRYHTATCPNQRLRQRPLAASSSTTCVSTRPHTFRPSPQNAESHPTFHPRPSTESDSRDTRPLHTPKWTFNSYWNRAWLSLQSAPAPSPGCYFSFSSTICNLPPYPEFL